MVVSYVCDFRKYILLKQNFWNFIDTKSFNFSRNTVQVTETFALRKLAVKYKIGTVSSGINIQLQLHKQECRDMTTSQQFNKCELKLMQQISIVPRGDTRPPDEEVASTPMARGAHVE